MGQGLGRRRLYEGAHPSRLRRESYGTHQTIAEGSRHSGVSCLQIDRTDRGAVLCETAARHPPHQGRGEVHRDRLPHGGTGRRKAARSDGRHRGFRLYGRGDCKGAQGCVLCGAVCDESVLRPARSGQSADDRSDRTACRTRARTKRGRDGKGAVLGGP